jgi:DNA-binding NarL/FixJ family response regulator
MRVLIADNQPKVRLALRILLEQEHAVIGFGEASDICGLLAEINATCPDLVLLDWGFPGLSGLDLLAAMRRVCPDLRVIALSSQPDEAQTIMDAGVDAFVSKTDLPEQVLAAIRSVKRINVTSRSEE